MKPQRVASLVCGVIVAIVAGCTAGARAAEPPPLAPAAPAAAPAGTAVQIQVDAAVGRRPISPYIYGKNNEVSQLDPQFVADAGLRIARDSGGNNCTKLNWKKDLSSHPDWYNNVYEQHLHERATKLSTQYGDLQALYGLQVLGWVAKTNENNFADWPQTPNMPKANNNLAGEGKPERYLEPWTPKDTVDLLDHWFKPKPDGLGLDPKHFRYFHLDNEPECWASTHDDVTPKAITGEQALQKYVAVAKELKSRYPDVRVLAPGFSSEWFWWNWSDQNFVGGLPWMQYFVKRMAEESKSFGRPLIDVVDFHTYIGDGSPDADSLQEWRIFYDPDYACPKGNGCKRYPDGGWHDNQKVEMIFGRMEQWLDEYFGKGHKIGISVTETGPGKAPGGKERSSMVLALWYASMFGTFADHGVEVFTTWEWYEPFWEVMHLCSRYGREVRVQATSSDEHMVSAYASVSEKGDGMTVILVNRDPAAARTANVTLAGFEPRPGQQTTLTLSDLPADHKVRTFKSHQENALKKGGVGLAGNSVSVALPPYSIVAVVMEGTASPAK